MNLDGIFFDVVIYDLSLSKLILSFLPLNDLPFIFSSLTLNGQERLEYIEKDHREYTLDDEDRKVQDVIMKPDPSKKDTAVLKKTLSFSYPNLPLDKAIETESQKLQLELQRSQANLDVGQCEVIQHLIEVTEVVATNSMPQKSPPTKNSKKLEPSKSVGNEKEHHDESYTKRDKTPSTSRLVFSN